MNDENIGRLEENRHAEYRNAGVNAGLAIAAFVAVKPELKKGADKLKDKLRKEK